jgi:membrane protease YdiL (CAAX protease family)
MNKIMESVLGNTQSNYMKAYLVFEFTLLFAVLPTVMSLNWAGTSPILFILIVFIAMIVYLTRSPTFPNKNFLRLDKSKQHLKRIAIVFVCAGVVLLAYVLLAFPHQFLAFARSKPLIYAMVMVLYPFFSAYPQEVIYRGFLFTRYAPLFGSGPGMVIASGLAFGYAHIIFLNALAVGLSTIGGLLFAFTYMRSRSLLVTTFEHALYGCYIFTIGLGQFFYHGAVQQ